MKEGNVKCFECGKEVPWEDTDTIMSADINGVTASISEINICKDKKCQKAIIRKKEEEPTMCPLCDGILTEERKDYLTKKGIDYNIGKGDKERIRKAKQNLLNGIDSYEGDSNIFESFDKELGL